MLIWHTAGDRATPLEDWLLWDGEPFDLTDCTVQLNVTAAGNTKVIDAAAVTIISATGGQIRYYLKAGELETPGFYFLQWRVVKDGRYQHFPTTGPHIVQVVAPAGYQATTGTVPAGTYYTKSEADARFVPLTGVETIYLYNATTGKYYPLIVVVVSGEVVPALGAPVDG